ncbi:LacI family DNA-binding transcriptional regulator [Mycobacterium decipiens]|uniref:LacI family transcriptional regulator n=1 Tax=Mycobacterium decipiens TaxID=1430326 RepID=A0A1X2LWC9_9MYCO|nr:LacI family DNA-binding transcriptional regulator [Mycobacterium decipiens]OSC40836.1 LacI family transcriptional regulator [Mycobacterium decipiens]
MASPPEVHSLLTGALENVETARRVLRAAESLGCRANPIARSLRTSRTRTVGLLVPDLAIPLFPPIVRAAEDVLVQHGYDTFVASTGDDAAREQRLVDSLVARQVDGLIVATGRRDHALVEPLRDEGIKIVWINRRADSPDIAAVIPDDPSGMTQAVEHLVGLGHTRIAHLAGPFSTPMGVMRSAAFRHAAGDAGVADDPALTVECAGWSEADGATALRELLDRGVEFTAVIAANDLIALGCYDVFAEAGIDCPEQISLVGYNDIPFLDKLRPPMTSVRIPQAAVGAEAARLLLDCIEEPSRMPGTVLMPVTLMVRGSTASLPRRPLRAASNPTPSFSPTS